MCTCRLVVLPLPFWIPASAGVSVLDVKDIRVVGMGDCRRHTEVVCAGCSPPRRGTSLRLGSAPVALPLQLHQQLARHLPPMPPSQASQQTSQLTVESSQATVSPPYCAHRCQPPRYIFPSRPLDSGCRRHDEMGAGVYRGSESGRCIHRNNVTWRTVQGRLPVPARSLAGSPPRAMPAR